jgi:hypothetical protein
MRSGAGSWLARQLPYLALATGYDYLYCETLDKEIESLDHRLETELNGKNQVDCLLT